MFCLKRIQVIYNNPEGAQVPHIVWIINLLNALIGGYEMSL